MAERKKFIIPNADEVEKISNERPKVRPLFKSKRVFSGDVKTSTKTESDDRTDKPGPCQQKNEKKDITNVSKGSVRNLQFRSGISSRQFNIVTSSALQPPCKANTEAGDPVKKTNSELKLEVCQSEETSSKPSSKSTDKAVPSDSNIETDTTLHHVQRTRKVGMTFAEAFADLKDTKHYDGLQGSEKTVQGAAVSSTKSSNSIVVNMRQRGNPILKHIRNVPWEFGDILPDYVMGKTTCALFLSIRYHNLKPDYIHDRLKQLGQSYELRVLLVQVDVKDPHHAVKDLTKIAILADCTLILAWSPEEAGRYLETFKAYESKPPDMLKERVDSDYLSRAIDCLTTVKKVNKTDVVTLLSTFGSMEGIAKASKEELALCPGIGLQKAQRLCEIFHEPFLRSKKAKIEEPKPGPSTAI
ncbi:DNA excision repair protein ERCC-1-like [Ptychodera flava]|uniref:DNA excision repair protein ERCC-1-like n=1 Tax=Ptychodera flava TaxID=63121 RepID=UPI003969C0FC